MPKPPRHPSDGCMCSDEWMTPAEKEDREDERFARHDAFITNARFSEYQPENETVQPVRKENFHE